MKKTIIIAAALFVFTMPTMKAQTFLDIEGLITQEKMVARYGKPDSLKIRHYDEGMGELYEFYHYGDDYLEVVDGDVITLDVNTSRFPLFCDAIEGGVRVGDPVSKLLKHPRITKKEKNSQFHAYKIWIGEDDYPVQVGMDETETYIKDFYYYYIDY